MVWFISKWDELKIQNFPTFYQLEWVTINRGNVCAFHIYFIYSRILLFYNCEMLDRICWLKLQQMKCNSISSLHVQISLWIFNRINKMQWTPHNEENIDSGNAIAKSIGNLLYALELYSGSLWCLCNNSMHPFVWNQYPFDLIKTFICGVRELLLHFEMLIIFNASNLIACD